LPLLLTGALLSVLPFVLHWALWRVYLPRRQTRAIVLLALVVDAVSLLGLAWSQGTLAGAPGAPSPVVYAHLGLFMFAMPQGLEPEKFLARLGDDVLVLPRVRDLERDGMAEVRQGRYVLTPKGRSMAKGFTLFARLQGIGLGG
jgi:hypothetical protein